MNASEELSLTRARRALALEINDLWFKYQKLDPGSIAAERLYERLNEIDNKIIEIDYQLQKEDKKRQAREKLPFWKRIFHK